MYYSVNFIYKSVNVMLYSSVSSFLQNVNVKSGSIEMECNSVNLCKESVHADSESIGMVWSF